MTRAEILAGLRDGKVLCIVRRDAPELATVLELQAEGLVHLNLKQLDEQSSRLEVRLLPDT